MSTPRLPFAQSGWREEGTAGLGFMSAEEAPECSRNDVIFWEQLRCGCACGEDADAPSGLSPCCSGAAPTCHPPGTSQDPDEAPPALWAGEPGTVGGRADEGSGAESGPRCEPRAKAGPSRGLNGVASGLM